MFRWVSSAATLTASAGTLQAVNSSTVFCASGAENWKVKFRTPSGTANIGASQALVHPGLSPRPVPYSLLDQYDVAILTLAATAPLDASRYMLDTAFDGAIPVSPIDIVGYGFGGSATTGIQSLGVRRHSVRAVKRIYLTGGTDLHLIE
jgi:hypothetical protein